MTISREHSVLIRVPIGMVFAFYAYPPNAQLLPSRGYRLSDWELPDAPGLGAKFGCTLRAWAWTRRLRFHWESYEAPDAQGRSARLVATAIEGPFALVRHEIDLSCEGPQVGVREIVTCEFGTDLRSRLAGRFATGELERVLFNRQHFAKRILEASHRPLAIPHDGAAAAAFLAVQIISENDARQSRREGRA